MSEKLDLVAHILTAYLSHNRLPAGELPTLIASVNHVVSNLGSTVAATPPPPEPAVSIRSSVKKESVACLECANGSRH